MGPFNLLENTSLTLELEEAGVLPADLDEDMTEEEVRALINYKKGTYKKATNERRFLPTDSPILARRAWADMVFARAASKAKPRDYYIFDMVVMNTMTITEAAAIEGIPPTTARDRYNATLLAIRKAIRNEPEVHAMVTDLCTEANLTVEELLEKFDDLGDSE